MNTPTILTARELGDHLRVSEATIRAMAHRGEIPGAFRVGKQWRFHASIIDTMAPPVTDDECASPPQSASTNAPTVATASAGANTADNAKYEATPTAPRPKTKPRESGSAFARDFPEYATPSRSAS